MTHMQSSASSTFSTAGSGRPTASATHSRRLSAWMLALLIVMLFSVVLFLSPPRDEGYPGRIPWSPNSILKSVTDAMSWWNVFPTARGVEIKDIFFNFAAPLGLFLLALRLVNRDREVRFARHIRQPWLHAQLLLGVWVLLSFWSVAWARAPADFAWGQAALYAIAYAWAFAVGWTLQPRHLTAAISAIIFAASGAALLCIWYFYERNPMHRPGFPIGSPATLSAVVAAGGLLALARIVGGPATSERGGAAGAKTGWQHAILPFVAIGPIGLCLWLTFSRATIVGLVAGVAALILLRVRSRVRWLIVLSGIACVGAAGYWLVFVSGQDWSMARGGTLRYRIYTWRYAAEIWQQNASAGMGAGCYPCLAPEHSVADRAIDPGAFFGEVSHAHNELFEVFAEIGLVGGVTWVGGMIATLYAAIRSLRIHPRRPRSTEIIGLAAAFIALLVDSLFSPNLRLPGVPAFFFTTLGLLWASAKGVSDEYLEDATDAIDALPQPSGWRTRLAAISAVAGMIGVGFFAYTNTRGVVEESRAHEAFRNGEFQTTARRIAEARQFLLDPVRKLHAESLETRAQLALAQRASQAFLDHLATARAAAASAPVNPQSAALQQIDAFHREAVDAAGAAHETASMLAAHAPGGYRSAAMAARAASIVKTLLGPMNPPEAEQWAQKAHAAWRQQRLWTPYDFETLTSLLPYPAPLGSQVELLRDALRADEADIGLLSDILADMAQHPAFGEVLENLMVGVGPLTPETDADTLVKRFAPETWRLAAAYAAQRGDMKAAAEKAATAARLAAPLRSRFPTGQSRALVEQAYYLFSLSPAANSVLVIPIVNEAIRLLPVIQEQKYDELAAPYRHDLMRYLFAAGRIPEAEAVAAELTQDPTRARDALIQAGNELVSEFFPAAGFEKEVNEWLARVLALNPKHPLTWLVRVNRAVLLGGPSAMETELSAAQQAGVEPADVDAIRSQAMAALPTSQQSQ